MTAARVVKAVGAALVVSGSMALVSRAYPREERGRALGLWAAASTLTTALRPVLGGAIPTGLGDIGWRLIFALNLPLGMIALWLLHGRTAQDTTGRTARIDWRGAILASVGLLLCALVLTDSAAPSALWFATPAVLGTFVVWQAVVLTR